MQEVTPPFKRVNDTRMALAHPAQPLLILQHSSGSAPMPKISRYGSNLVNQTLLATVLLFIKY